MIVNINITPIHILIHHVNPATGIGPVNSTLTQGGNGIFYLLSVNRKESTLATIGSATETETETGIGTGIGTGTENSKETEKT